MGRGTRVGGHNAHGSNYNLRAVTAFTNESSDVAVTDRIHDKGGTNSVVRRHQSQTAKGARFHPFRFLS